MNVPAIIVGSLYWWEWEGAITTIRVKRGPRANFKLSQYKFTQGVIHCAGAGCRRGEPTRSLSTAKRWIWMAIPNSNGRSRRGWLTGIGETLRLRDRNCCCNFAGRLSIVTLCAYKNSKANEPSGRAGSSPELWIGFDCDYDFAAGRSMKLSFKPSPTVLPLGHRDNIATFAIFTDTVQYLKQRLR